MACPSKHQLRGERPQFGEGLQLAERLFGGQ